MSRILTMIEFVTDLVFGENDVATCKGLGDHELEPVAGWHFGFYSRPRDGARGLVVKLGGEGNSSFLIAYRDKQYEITLEKGEVGIANAFEAQILLNKDGEVVVNGGTKKVARVDDTLTASANLTTWAQAVETALNAATSPILPASSWGTLGNGSAGALGDIATGADKFKA
jgi:phage gp45-like